jgi:hypothetical protein
MKKIFLFVFFIILMRFTLNAQDNDFSNRFSARVGVGYGIGLCYDDPCDYYYEDYYPTYNTYKSINFVPGRGFNVNVGASYMFTKNIGVDLGVRDFCGSPIRQSINNYYGETGNQTSSRTYKGMILGIVPGIVLDLGMEKIDPYARFGMIIGAYPLVTLRETEVRNGDTYDYTGKYLGNVPLGFEAAIGVRYNLSNHFSLFSEFDCNGINYTPKKYKLTKYSVNGVDELSTLTTKQKNIDFVKTYDAMQTIPDDSPDKQLKLSFPFSNFELNVGARWRF